MQTDRQILAQHYETRKTLALLEKSGWPEWATSRGSRVSLRWNGEGNCPGWMYYSVTHDNWLIERVGDHTALCILRNDLLTKTGNPPDDAALLAGLAAAQTEGEH